MAEDGNKPLVFISYACEDEKIAKAFGELINRTCTGVRVWFSGDGRPGCGCTFGGLWFNDIHEHLEAAEYVFALVTANSINRPWIYWESGIGFVRHNHGHVVPVLMGLTFSEIGDPLHQLSGVEAANHDRLCSTMRQIASTLQQEPLEKDVEKYCSEFWDEVKDAIPTATPGETSILSDPQVVRQEDLDAFGDRLEKKMSTLLRRQAPPQEPLTVDQKGTREPVREVTAAAAEAVELRQAGASLPNDLVRTLAAKLYEFGELQLAEAILRPLAHGPAGTAPDHAHLGAVLHGLGRTPEAEACYRHAIDLSPGNAVAWYNLGNLLREGGRSDEALEAYQKAVAADPQLGPGWCNLGNLLSEAGKTREAEDAYQNAIATDPRPGDAWYNLGILFDRVGRATDADNALRKATERMPGHARAWAALGSVLQKQNRTGEAEHAFRKALEADSKLAPAWHNYGILLRGAGRVEEAESAWRKAIACDAQCAEAWATLGLLLSETGRSEEAEETYRAGMQANPSDPGIRNNFAFSLCQQGRRIEAETMVCEPLALDRNHPYANATLGLVLLEKNELDEGRKQYERAVELKPDDKPLQQKFHFEYGRALARNGRRDEAREHLEVAKKSDASFVPMDKIDAELAKLDGAE